MFPVLFALGRSVGWISQWVEMIQSPDHRISRPRQLYTGHPLRSYVPVEDRG
jgi:citrate synthase